LKIEIVISMKLTRSKLREMILKEMMGGGPSMTKRNTSRWRAWTGGSLKEREQSDDDSIEEVDCWDGYSPGAQTGKKTKKGKGGKRVDNCEKINEKQEAGWNPTVHGGFEKVGVSKDIHGSVIGAETAGDAVKMFIEKEEITQGDYSVTCTPAAGKSWTCIANRAELGRENIVSFPEEEGPDLD
jgi:hypothetical protein